MQPHDITEIQKFYSKKHVLLTGATGFIGKLVMIKLLHSCPDLEKLYIIGREKKGKSAKQRIKESFDAPVFKPFCEAVPNYLDKCVIINGDCALPEIGLTEEDKKLLISKINIIFHNAATVRFDEDLKIAAAINIKATKYLLQMAKKMNNLQAFVHVSTAYANCIHHEIEERFYKPVRDPEEFLKYLDTTDDRKIAEVTPSIIQDFPNTYAYTKHLTEAVIAKEANNLPIIVYRPSIVVGSFQEPVPGWVDNLYGPVGLSIAVGLGLVMGVQMDINKVSDIVPADGVANGMIACAWYKVKRDSKNEMKVVNYVSGKLNTLKWKDYVYWTITFGKCFPVDTWWYYTMTPTTCVYYFYLIVFFTQLLPATFIDAYTYVTSGKTRMLKIFKKCYNGGNLLKYFTLNDWVFEDRNIRQIWKSLDKQDKDLYWFNMETLSWDEYFLKYIKYLRSEVLKFPKDNVPYYRERMQWLETLHYTIKYGIIFLFINYIYSRMFSI